MAEEKLNATSVILKTPALTSVQKEAELLHVKQQLDAKFFDFTLAVGVVMSLFIIFFTWLMRHIVNETIQEYKAQVHAREASLEELNRTLHAKVARGIQEGIEKDKAILRESRLARLGSMLSMIAHQWRQPLSELSAVLMEMEMAAKFNRLNGAKVHHSLSKCNERIEHMSQTIDDFRLFYKPDKKKSHFYLKDACTKALNLASAALKHARVEVVLTFKDNPLVCGYPTEFSQVLLNIITNAKDVFLERNIPHPRMEIAVETTPTQHCVCISDNGGGIESVALEYLFDPYFSTKESHAGTGMGLYIAKIIVENKMHGTIHVANTDAGAAFTLTFPKEPADAS
jgi:signal transduction histidine kinase